MMSGTLMHELDESKIVNNRQRISSCRLWWMPYGRWPLQNLNAMQPHPHTHLAQAECGQNLFFGSPTNSNTSATKFLLDRNPSGTSRVLFGGKLPLWQRWCLRAPRPSNRVVSTSFLLLKRDIFTSLGSSNGPLLYRIQFEKHVMCLPGLNKPPF